MKLNQKIFNLWKKKILKKNLCQLPIIKKDFIKIKKIIQLLQILVFQRNRIKLIYYYEENLVF